MKIEKQLKDEGRASVVTKIYVTVKVHPRARKQVIEEGPAGELKLRVKSSPSKGEANREVITVLASHFGLPRSRVKIIRGQKSRLKLISLKVDNEDLSRSIYQRYIQKGKGQGWNCII